MATPALTPWPALPAGSWTATRETLQRWLQIVGKTRLALSPMLNQWWQVSFYVSARGLTTGPIPYPAGAFEVLFDFQVHQLVVTTSTGVVRQLPLLPQSVADFYLAYRALLREAGIKVKIWAVPVEVQDAPPFAHDQYHASYDADATHRFWQIVLRAAQVLEEFRGRFTGKCSPVHFFWGSFDLAVTRFSGRPAPPHPGGVPHLADWVTRAAYNEEVSSAGWWPGGDGAEAAFYSYAYPTPAGFAEAPVRPSAASFNPQLGEFLLPYDQVRTAPDPRQAVLEFLQSTYKAAAGLAAWDRPTLERLPARG
jgi:hypothetical protein